MTEPADPGRDARNGDLTTLARGGVVNLLGSVSQAIFGFGLLAVLGRGMGAAGAGAFVEAIALFNIVAVTATLGVDTGLIRSVARMRAQGRGSDLRRTYRLGYVPVLIVGSGAAVVLFLFAESIAGVIGATHSEEIAEYLRVMAPFLPVASLLLTSLGATRGYETMLPTVLVDRATKLGLQAVLVFLAIAFGAPPALVALAWALPIVAGSVWALLWLRRLDNDDDLPAATPASWGELGREFWAFTLPRAFASIFRTAVQWLDILLVGALMSPRAAGIYAVSTRLLQVGIAIAFAVGQVSQPMIGRMLARAETDKTRSVFGTAATWQVLATWPQYLAIAIFAAPVLSLFGAEFTQGAPVVVILAVSTMIGSAAGPVDMVLLMAGKSMWSFWNTAASLSVNVVLNLLLIPRLGITGAAVAWAAARVIGNLLPLAQVAKHLRLHPFGSAWAIAATSSTLVFGGLGLAARALFGADLLALAGYLLVSAVAYAYLLRRYRSELELAAIVDALRHRFRPRAMAPPR